MLEYIFFLAFMFMVMMITYSIFHKEITSPTFIVCVGFFMSCFIMLFYYSSWNVDFSLMTGLYIFIGIASLFFGELAAGKIRVLKAKSKPQFVNEVIHVKGIVIAACTIIAIVTALLYYRAIVMIDATYGSLFGATASMLMRVRKIKNSVGASVPSYIQQMYSLSGAIAAILSYTQIHNAMFAKKKVNLFAWIPVVIFVINSLFTTGRTGLLNFFIYLLFVWLILRAKKQNWIFNNNYKAVFRGFGIFLLAITAFYLAGMLTEKSFHYDNMFDNIANYFSSSIYAFNDYVKHPSEFVASNQFLGAHTFSGIYSFLRKFGFSIPDDIVALEYINCGKYVTNIYTALRRYIQDFSVFGMSIIMALIGFFYKKLVNLNKMDSSTPLTCILTSWFMFPLVFMSVEERVFMDVFIIRSVYQIIYMYFAYQWIVNGRFLKYRLKL